MKKIIFALLFCSTAASAASDAERGRSLYMKVGCYQCHGTVGQGGVAGTRLAPDPMAWEAFAQFVHTTADTMPPYREEVLPTSDLKAIYIYLQSIPQPPSVDKIPLLKNRNPP